jgi:hypothetical protein
MPPDRTPSWADSSITSALTQIPTSTVTVHVAGRAASSRRRSPGVGCGVTFQIGDNGTDKLTLEALAVATGFNPECGLQSFRFTTQAGESSLGITWCCTETSTNHIPVFLRAESFYNVATEIDRLRKETPYLLLLTYDGRSLHECSHGESFLDLMTHRFGPDGLHGAPIDDRVRAYRCSALLYPLLRPGRHVHLSEQSVQGPQMIGQLDAHPGGYVGNEQQCVSRQAAA